MEDTAKPKHGVYEKTKVGNSTYHKKDIIWRKVCSYAKWNKHMNWSELYLILVFFCFLNQNTIVDHNILRIQSAHWSDCDRYSTQMCIAMGKVCSSLLLSDCVYTRMNHGVAHQGWAKYIIQSAINGRPPSVEIHF